MGIGAHMECLETSIDGAAGIVRNAWNAKSSEGDAGLFFLTKVWPRPLRGCFILWAFPQSLYGHTSEGFHPNDATV
eukprot:1157228-Pelagomonas_calceolata.AAC.3